MSRTTLSILSRRDFLRLSGASGAALMLGWYFPFGCARPNDLPVTAFEPNLYLSITSDDTVTVTMPRSEMGQKIYTALPMILAEELEADWSKVKVKQGDFNPAFGNQTTGGSRSIRSQYDRLRKAGATAREMLISAAAERWEVPRSECRAEVNQVLHKPSGRSLRYGELVGIASTLPVPKDVPLKNPEDFRIIGTSIKSLNTSAKIDGSLVFGYDFTLPDMFTAVVKRCPVLGGRAKSWDASQTRAVSGVIDIVEISSGIAVVATSTWAALQGREKLKIEWDYGDLANLDSDDISKTMHSALENSGSVLRQDGNTGQALTGSKQTLEATFEVPYLDHAPMEPMNCTAHLHDGICEVWAPTQNPGAAHEAARNITGFKDDQVVVHTIRMGGGFGRRLQTDFVEDAVEVAQKISQPTKVIRLRDEDIQHGFYRPATVHHLRGGLNEQGQVVAWTHRVSGPQTGWHGMITGGAAELAYEIPNISVDYVMSPIPVPIGAWRSVANTQNALVNECFVDELAIQAGRDPVAFRHQMLKHSPRHLGVLNLATERAGWGDQLPKGHFQGVAVHFCFESYMAVVAEISIDNRYGVTIHRMVCAIDCGTVINPDGVRAQVEGGVAMGLTAAFYGKITLEDGAVEQSNFHDYPILSMDEMPQIETHIVDSTEPPTGAGEPPVPPTPPALLNAIAAATGKRIYKLPIDMKQF